jgi:misacylated tRNA(Ala) deacylase
MTEKVFYQDSYQKTHRSEVVEVVDHGVILAATIFYPLGGGQPGDSGRLIIGEREYRVVDTRFAEDRNNIIHQLEDEDLSAIHAGDAVDMEIDWQRRHRLMRMHSSMHLLCSLISAQATGGAVGETSSRLDFDLQGQVIDKQQLTAELNALVEKALPISIGSITDAELEQNPGLVHHVGTAAAWAWYGAYHFDRGYRLPALWRHPRAQHRRDWRAVGYRPQKQGQAKQAYKPGPGRSLGHSSENQRKGLPFDRLFVALPVRYRVCSRRAA